MASSNQARHRRTALWARAAGFLLSSATAGVPACGAEGPIVPVEERSICSIPPEIEFGPSHCALVRGVARDRFGQALAGVAVRADSVICCLLVVYGSGTAVTRSDGSFDLMVTRHARPTPPTTPDTVRMNLLLYYRDRQAAALDPPDARAPVLMWFAEIGKEVPRTLVDVRFPFPD